MMDPVKLLRIDPNLPQPGHVGEQVEKSLAFFVFDEDITAGLATVHDVIVRAGYSIRSGLAMPIFYFIVNLVSIAKSGLDPFRLFDFLGNERLVFSTDFPHVDTKYPKAVERFLELPITDEDKRKILWDNCATYYGMVGI